ncbi:MAG: tetratricopeptide repeat protein [Alphaproteobacteria bacterium]|nr:tetratricopeptide repeat protein [Alphaproteobacteria bacterium]
MSGLQISAKQLRALELAVLALAVGLRVAAWSSIGETPYAENPLVDAYTYWDQAKSLLAGEDPFAEGYYQPPGYPWLLYALFSAVGGEPSLSVARVAHMALGVFTTGALMRLGRRLGERVGGWPWAGALAGLLYTLYPTTLLFELDLLTPAVTNALLVGSLLLLGVEARPSLGRALGSGLLLGGAAVVHPTVLSAAPVYLLVLAGLSEGARWRRPAAWALGLGLALAPTATTNQARWGETALVSHNAGLNFYLGNNADWRRTSFLRAGLPFRQLVLEADPGERDTFERNDYWRERTLTEIRQQPGTWLATLATKSLWSVNNREIPRNEDYRCRTESGPLAWLGALPARYGWVFPLAALGAALSARRRDLSPLLVGSWLALQAGMVLFLVADRYRLSTWPMMCLLAPLGVGGLLQLRARWREGLRPSPAWAALLIAAALPWWPIDWITAKQPGWCAHQRGNFALQEQRYDEAIRDYEEALSWEPENIGTWHWLGMCHSQLGQWREAAEAFDEVLERFPMSYSTAMAAAKAYNRLDERSEEADRLGLACAVPGPRDNTCARYVEALLRVGRRDEALAVLREQPGLQDHPRVKEALGGR